jgi:hypothetical protein
MSPNLSKYAPLLGLAIAAIVLISAVLTRKDNPDLLRFTVENNRAYGYGFTDGRSIGVVRKLVRDNPQVDTLVLANMPGTRDVVSNDRLGREIRKAGLKTHLEADSFIASGAVSLFLAGVERSMDCGARIGVHAWGSVGFDAQGALTDNMRGFKRDYLSDMGINPDFYDYTKNAARADDLHIMVPDEVRDWDLLTTPLADCS